MKDEGPFMRRMRRFGKIGEAGRASEKRTAQRLGGRQTHASGALATDKGDVEMGQFLMECKSTSQASLGLKLEWLLKITQEAVLKEKTPAIAISFTNDHGLPIKNANWVAIPEAVFKRLFEE